MSPVIRIEGKGGISATILADSISKAGVRITTFEITYPRIILAEYNTHCMISRASASSRAIPFPKMVDSLMGAPVRFGQANPGMQDKGVDYDAPVGVQAYLDCDMGTDPDGDIIYSDTTGWLSPELAWQEARDIAIQKSREFYEAGYHKQVYNRLTEPFQMMKTVTTATEWNNFFWLRNDGAADPTLHELARCMQEARDASVPFLLLDGEWHLPYLEFSRVNGEMRYFIRDEEHDTPIWLTLEQALKVSAARCAAVSFRNVDYTLEKSEGVFDRLVGDERKHASAFEHQATPMETPSQGSYRLGIGAVNTYRCETWEDGISHVDRNGQLWSGKLRGWVCHRKLIPGENREG